MSKRINLLHLSDLHLTSASEPSAKPIITALKNDISGRVSAPVSPNVFVFSGDIVQSGDQEDSYSDTYESVIVPILDSTSCDTRNFFMVPGNHDVQRGVVSENLFFLEGLIGDVKDNKNLNGLIENKTFNEYCAKAFSNYGNFRSALESELTIKSNNFYSSAYVPDLGLSIVTINSALVSFAGLNKVRDEGRLLFPDAALLDAVESVPENSTKILVSHHPIEYFAEWNQLSLKPIVRKHFDVHLFGHMHDDDPVSCITPLGTVLNHQSGAIYATDSYFKGYSILSMMDGVPHIQVSVREYFDKRLEFDAANSVAKDGLFHNSEESKNFWRTHATSIDIPVIKNWLSETASKVIKTQLDFRLYEKSITEVFVEPPIYTRPLHLSNDEEGYETDKNDPITVDQIVNGTSNKAIYGLREHGKSTLLKSIAISILERPQSQSLVVPIVLNFEDVKVGRRQVQSSIRAALNCDLPSGVTLEKLLSMGMFTILIDDYDVLDKARYRLFSAFMDEYPKNRFILTVGHDSLENIGGMLLPEFPVPFEVAFIAPLTRTKMGELVQKWTGNNKNECEKTLDRIIDNLIHINVPSTPVVGTIFLTIFDRHEDFTPINQSVLVQQFIETLLDKHAPLDSRRETYDFRNKEHYLSYVAGHMVTTETYRLAYRDLVSLTEKYFEDYAFVRNAEKDIEMFEQSRIFIFEGDKAFVSFRYRSFCEYFIAKYMEDNPNFLNLLLQGDEFLSFLNELDYYSGIKRNHLVLVDATNDQLEQILSDIDVKIDINGYEGFRMPHSNNAEHLVDEILSSLAATLEPEERDKLLEHRLPLSTGYQQRIFRPKGLTPGAKWISGMDLYSRLIKNGEVITAKERQEHLYNCFAYWSVFMAQSLFIVPELAANKEHTINGIVYRAIGWEGVDENVLVEKLCEAVAMDVGSHIKRALGSEKLVKLLSSPLREGEPLIITFLRKMLYVDLRLPDYILMLEEVLRDCKDSEYLSIVILRKMQYIHKVEILPTKESEAVRNLITMQAQKFSDNKSRDKDSKYRSGLFAKLKKAESVRKQKNALHQHSITKSIIH